MGIFKTRKNKTYSYIPRHFDDKGQGNPYKIKGRFDEYRKTASGSTGLKSKFTNALDELKSRPDREVNRRILIIVAVLLLIFLFIIDFDLSIFFSKK